VDTHVHRISNLWGYVKTRTPEETEFALRKKLPRKHWITYNDLLVTFGQNLCVPVSPWCSRCAVEKFCEKIGLKRHRCMRGRLFPISHCPAFGLNFFAARFGISHS